MIDWPAYGWTALGVLVFGSVAFVVAQRRRRLDIADVAWGGGLITAALISFLLQPEADSLTMAVRTLATSLVIVWGMRLSRHIWHRIQARPEDERYVKMRAAWRGKLALNAFLRVFAGQAVLALLVATPVVVLNLTAANLAPNWGLALALAGGLLWLVGFVIEQRADQQLQRFLANPAHKGKLMTSGLWRYSRHPNYFGEVTQWWGLFVIGLGLPLGLWGLVGAGLITGLILFGSGIPLLEKKYAGRKDWQAYKRRTSKFIPWPPRTG